MSADKYPSIFSRPIANRGYFLFTILKTTTRILYLNTILFKATGLLVGSCI